MWIARRTALALLALLGATPLPAAEGMWRPEQLRELDAAALARQGLELPLERLWGSDGAGLLSAAVSVGGCSAGFVSAQGLLLTNHHCVVGILQQHSQPGRDLLAEGFLAGRGADELPGQTTRASVPSTSRDVTREIEAAVPPGADDLARFRAIEARQQELIAACERQPNRRCQVESFDGGVAFALFENLEYPDVRLVWAPPGSVGDFGGEIDNWSWPRHTGDFALLRVYAAADGSPAPRAESNVPLSPRHFFPLTTKGVAEGDFISVAGYPGATTRSLSSAEMRERGERFFPARAALYRAWLDIGHRLSKADEAVRLALAARLDSLANREKNARGQIAGLARGRILERRAAAEATLLAWAEKRPAHAAAVAAQRELAALAAERAARFERDFLLGEARVAARPLDLALTLVRWAGERSKPDAEREPDYRERNRARLSDRLERAQSEIALEADAALLADWLMRAAAHSGEQPIAAVAALIPAGAKEGYALAKARALLSESKVSELAERQAMAAQSAAELAARRDPLLDFAAALDRELKELKERNDRFRGAVYRLRPALRRAAIAQAGRPIAPDANGTLRVSFGQVRGYSPRDGIWMRPQTTLVGLREKLTGEPPFAAPERLLRAVAAAPRSRWADARLGTVPVAFLADGDTTGGNSGSPVLNGRGEIVGVNFDRVWENVANDFGYNPEVARHISADSRYMLWLLETLHGEAAAPLLAELGVAAPAY